MPAVVTVATVETVGGLGLQADTRNIPANGTAWAGSFDQPVYGPAVKVSGFKTHVPPLV